MVLDWPSLSGGFRSTSADILGFEFVPEAGKSPAAYVVHLARGWPRKRTFPATAFDTPVEIVVQKISEFADLKIEG